MENKSIISTQLLQQVVDYLQTRPYKEVNELIVSVVNGAKPFNEEVVKPNKEKK